ncbi:hypothetical protein [Brachyspira hyodysenteriae]|uniref:hypothetical protein n=1 Tax=Brachyspira hyodysenteriae TaxID=159 RepID=UPI0022CE0357|nr:hypothetical protein [Brachyspira hyodysenteriae]MDA0085858.1 hypothetical protein [Brachyspira hyodysenteriae]
MLIPLFESNRENIEEAVKSALNIVIQKANNKYRVYSMHRIIYQLLKSLSRRICMKK